MQKQQLSFDTIPGSIAEILTRIQNIETFMETPMANTSAIEVDDEPYIYGINGLAKFLRVSTPTAQKIKNSGKVPYSQAERTIIFRKAEVLEALSNKKNRR